jgi:hypothetical protein
MTDLLYNKLPEDVVNMIKLYTGEMVIRNGKYIKRIKRDYRYDILNNKPKIKQIYNDYSLDNLKGIVWFKLNNKFIVISVRYKMIILKNNIKIFGYFHEIHYNKNEINYLIK